MDFDLSWLASQFPKLSKIEGLAAGGQKWVFKCEHPDYQDCVLKLFKPGAEGRIDREIEAMSRLHVQNIPRVFDSGLVESPIGSLLWVLEQRIEGILLSDALKRGPLDKDRLLALALGLLTAAAAAESVKVVHRDIKPDNIIIDPNNRPWLLDFGIARVLDLESKTRSDAKLGPHTLGYGSPEQCRNRKREIDGRADLFAIGVVLYESASGLNPYIQGARDRIAILDRVEHLELKPLLLSWDPKHRFADFISALLQKYPYRRPRSCQEALGWFQDILRNGELQ